jgi:hypothetical protein
LLCREVITGITIECNQRLQNFYIRRKTFMRLDKGLDEAKANGWTVVDMKKDWKTIYPQLPITRLPLGCTVMRSSDIDTTLHI